MKQDAMDKFKADSEAAIGTVYDSGFADGVASVPASPDAGVTPEQEQADIDAAVAPLHAQIDSLGLQVDQVKKLKDSLAALLASLS